MLDQGLMPVNKVKTIRNSNSMTPIIPITLKFHQGVLLGWQCFSITVCVRVDTSLSWTCACPDKLYFLATNILYYPVSCLLSVSITICLRSLLYIKYTVLRLFMCTLLGCRLKPFISNHWKPSSTHWARCGDLDLIYQFQAVTVASLPRTCQEQNNATSKPSGYRYCLGISWVQSLVGNVPWWV